MTIFAETKYDYKVQIACYSKEVDVYFGATFTKKESSREKKEEP